MNAHSCLRIISQASAKLPNGNKRHSKNRRNETRGAQMTSENNQVDLIGEAYQNARAEGVQLRTGGAGYTKLVAPAKVNLYLGVGEKLEDGYHPVENVMHTLLAHDVLYMRCLSAQAFAYETGIAFTNTEESESQRDSNLKIHLTCSGTGAIVPP